eukprot:TRINITY_DN19291_c0_g1_i4.p2 TRINITY_DN19291_c0_g1~~TRINITY_DN19291_c0_g1_i4.p2  ORF type:complete len:110 (+),score=6.19 TRINITY_DN19291_c0_g1_i4:47-376(+)
MRYMMGPKMVSDLEAYNSYFDVTGVDLLLVPATRVATPDLADLAKDAVPVTKVDGSTTGRGALACFRTAMFPLKHLHIPKLLIPTGLSADGRPTAIQLWGRALDQAQMY